MAHLTHEQGRLIREYTLLVAATAAFLVLLPLVGIASIALRSFILFLVAAVIVVAVGAGVWRVSYEIRSRHHLHK